jgi:hypothetical protein
VTRGVHTMGPTHKQKNGFNVEMLRSDVSDDSDGLGPLVCKKSVVKLCLYHFLMRQVLMLQLLNLQLIPHIENYKISSKFHSTMM